MKTIYNIPREVHLTLNSIDSIKRVAPSAFFYAKIQNKLNKATNNRWDKISEIVSRPSYAVLIFSILFIIDIITLTPKNNKNDSLPEGSIVAQYQELSTISDYFYDLSDEANAMETSK